MPFSANNLNQYTNSTVPGETTVAGNVLVARTPQAFTYDFDGNLTSDGLWTNVWNAENRLLKTESLTSVTAAARAREEWTYLPDGRWIQRIVSTNNGAAYYPAYTNRYVWDGQVLLAILDHTNGLVMSFMRGLDLSGTLQGAGGVGGVLAVSFKTNGTHFFCYDGNGNVTALVSATDGTESARYEYGPFAEPIRMTGPLAKLNPIRFSTQYADVVTGDVKYLFRDYDAVSGRWRSRDPKGERGGKNLFGMLDNEPITRTDVTGLAPCGNCGPDVTAAMDRTLVSISKVWDSWDTKEQTESCDALQRVSDGTAKRAWYIVEIGGLGLTNRASIRGAPPGTKECCRKNVCCDQTVTYKGHCYFAGDLHYLMYGLITKLCNISLHTAADNVAMWKQFNAIKNKCWAEIDFIKTAQLATGAGYHWEFTRLPQASRDADCVPRKDRGSDRVFEWNWEPHHMYDWPK